MTITVLADENIASLDDYFACHHNVQLIKLKGRNINQAIINQYNPDALLIRSVTPINANNMADIKNIKFIGSATIGIDHVDDDFLIQNNIFFANAKGSSKHSVAQYVITAILTKYPDFINKKITLGIIGLGNIGSTLVKYAQDLNWDILGYDPYLKKSTINNSDFYQLLNHSDVVSIHTPLTKIGDYPTYQLFDKMAFEQCKSHAMFINTARGEIICQEDLLNAIDDKNLQVILDVFPFEPIVDKRLLDKLIFATPHIAGYTLDGKLRGTDMIYRAFCDFFNFPILKEMNHLLPMNEFYWKNLKNNLHLLQSYYDILKDDFDLRQVCHDKISESDFDKLRKNYELRREWIDE